VTVLTIVLCLVLSSAFCLAQSMAWYAALRSAGVAASYRTCLKLMYMGAAIDITVFPARLSSDAFRLWYMRDRSLTSAALGIATFRMAALSPYLMYALLFAAQHARVAASGALSGVVLLAVATAIWRRKSPKSRIAVAIRNCWSGLLVAIPASSLAVTTEVLRNLALLSLVGLAPSWEMVHVYLASHMIGVLSGLPFGIGAKDLSLTAFLANHLSAGAIARYLLLARITGELASATAGLLLFGGEVREFLRQRRMSRQRKGVTA
jgi:uncharacterized membrane protein YbhN (UPF0104 family)